MALARIMLRGLIIGLLLVSVLDLASAEVRIENADRKINLNSQFARVTESLKLRNTGSSPVSSINICHLQQLSRHLAELKVTGATGSTAKVESAQSSEAPEGVHCHTVTLPSPLAAGGSSSVDVSAVFTAVQTPYPAEVSQEETQLVTYVDNLYIVSPYHVASQHTEVLLPSKSVMSYTPDRASQRDNKITYGGFDDVKPYTLSELRLHYENMKPFKQMVQATREIEVSHWGNIYVEEVYEIRNAGAAHKGAFSRLKYAHSYNGKGNSFRDLRASLPAAAHSLYYVDIIGNISTSNVRKSGKRTAVDVQLRYPLMGGWKTDFTLGYSLPLKKSLYNVKGGKKRLEMDIGVPFDDVYVEDMTVRVVLPEGATHIQPHLPPGWQVATDTKYTYLDTTGRPVLVLKRRNVVPEHNVKFAVEYSFPVLAMLREPLLLIAVFAALFGAVIVYNRSEFTISKDSNWAASKTKDRTTGVLQRISGLLADLGDVVSSVEQQYKAIRTAADAEASVTLFKTSTERKTKEIELKLATKLLELEDSEPKQAAQIRDTADKGKSLVARYIKQLEEKAALVKKAVPYNELMAKLGPNAKQLQASKADFDAQVNKLVAAY